MKIDVPNGKYVLAVSGGVDSMVLLDILVKQPQLELVVAHFNHGMRKDSVLDEELVREKARDYGLAFEAGYGQLEQDCSEDTARRARYAFLRDIRDKHEAGSIITAHHQDDLIETAVINLTRGTGPRGLVAISSNSEILRPLLGVSKKEILDYAAQNSIEWREDITNQDPRYLRNRVRQTILARLSARERQEILGYIATIEQNQREVTDLVADISQNVLRDKHTLNRQAFIFLPGDVAAEVLMNWLKKQGVGELDRPTVARLVTAVKTAPASTRQPIKKGQWLSFSQNSAHFTNTL